MPQHRVHQATSDKLTKLKDDINKERDKDGIKRLTVPDLISEIVDLFYTQRSIELKRREEP